MRTSKKLVTPTKSLKVYLVTFAEWTGKEEYLNVDSKTVLGETIEQATQEAISQLDTKDVKTYFVQSIELKEILS